MHHQRQTVTKIFILNATSSQKDRMVLYFLPSHIHSVESELDRLWGSCDTLAALHDNRCCQRQIYGCWNLYQRGKRHVHQKKKNTPKIFTCIDEHTRKHINPHMWHSNKIYFSHLCCSTGDIWDFFQTSKPWLHCSFISWSKLQLTFVDASWWQLRNNC